MNTRIAGKRLQARRDFIEWMRHFNKQATNRFTMRFAGKHIYAVIHHQGRKSGKMYKTPVVAMPWKDGFIFPLPYGENVDWFRNVQAAGCCRMEWRGRGYSLSNPQLIEPAEALRAFPHWMRPLLRETKIYLKLEGSAANGFPEGQKMRRVLVYGAGVLGSLFAGKLRQAGYDVTLLARGQRLEELTNHGLSIVEDGSGKLEQIQVQVIDTLGSEDAYDLVLVVVRKNQVTSVLPPLAANHCTPNILFLVNNAAGPGQMIEALGHERVLLGFPGAGGQREDGVIRYRLASSVQPTTIGEPDGQQTERLAQITSVFRDAGLPVAVSENMDAWLKTHVALVSPIANALYLAGGSNYRLARTPDGLVLLVRAVKEGLRVLQALRIPVTPAKYKVLQWLPEPLLVAILERRLGLPHAELVLARHANAARDEMLTLAEEFRVLARQSGVDTPAIDTLFCYTDPVNTPVPEGQAILKPDWRSTIAAGGALASAGLLAAWLLKKRKK